MYIQQAERNARHIFNRKPGTGPACSSSSCGRNVGDVPMCLIATVQACGVEGMDLFIRSKFSLSIDRGGVAQLLPVVLVVTRTST
jgi:hypothetical protein